MPYFQSNKIAKCAASFPGSSQTSVEENLPQAVNEAKLSARKLPKHIPVHACMWLCHRLSEGLC